jgi:hypothetical protein
MSIGLDDHLYATQAVFAGIGDVTSDAKGSGARFNGGKPDFSLVPLTMVARTMDAAVSRSSPAAALESLGVFQQAHDPDYLFDVLDRLGKTGGKNAPASSNTASGSTPRGTGRRACRGPCRSRALRATCWR